MSYEYVYKDNTLYCTEFQQAARHLQDYRLAEASHLFQLAYESVKRNDVYHNKYASFCGLVRVMQGDYGGLDLCRDAARCEFYDGDVYLNLAQVERLLRSRKRTVAAILKGLSIDETHPGLQQMQRELGVRKRNPIPLLKRQNRFNCMLGKLMRKQNRQKFIWIKKMLNKGKTNDKSSERTDD